MHDDHLVEIEFAEDRSMADLQAERDIWKSLAEALQDKLDSAHSRLKHLEAENARLERLAQ